MNIQLSEHFTYKKLLRFTFPSIIMMVFSSVYGVVDGFFVSNFAGKTAFTAVNFAMPVLIILGAVGFMFGTGGSAIIAISMGEKKPEEAKRQFSMLVWTAAVLGALLGILGIVFFRPIMMLLGATGSMLDDSVIYGQINLIALPAYTLQYAFQSFFIVAEKPNLGLKVTVASGVTNIILDALLVGVFRFGLCGAAAATALSQCVGGILPLIYFARKNSSTLRFTKAPFNGKLLLSTCVNGSSELMSSISTSVVSMMYNMQLLKYAGEDGISAYGVLMYVNFIFIAIFIGYSVGSAPIISYHFGAENYGELQNLRKKGILFIELCSVVMFALALVLARPLATLFVGYDAALTEMTVRGFYICSFAFLFIGLAIWTSAFFTALNNGLVSAVLSFVRSLIFQVAAVLILPIFLKLDGIWVSTVLAEVLAVIISVTFLLAERKKYHY